MLTCSVSCLICPAVTVEELAGDVIKSVFCIITARIPYSIAINKQKTLLGVLMHSCCVFRLAAQTVCSLWWFSCSLVSLSYIFTASNNSHACLFLVIPLSLQFRYAISDLMGGGLLDVNYCSLQTKLESHFLIGYL